MEYLAVLSFDVAGAPRSAYTAIYDALAAVGLYHVIKGQNGRAVLLPTTTCAGTFMGADTVSVIDFVTLQVRAVFDSLGYKATLFVGIGLDWGWVHNDNT